jgi:hypothetical protein
MDVAFPAVLATSQRWNSAKQITGALLACDGWFLQSIEGPRSALMETFHRISTDQRHEAINVLELGPLPERRFSAWSMCGRQMTPTDDAILDVLENRQAFNLTIKPTKACALLKCVQDLQSRPRPDNLEYI